MAEVGVKMEVGSDGVAVIAFSNPLVNALAIPIIDGLKEKFSEAGRRNDVKAIIVTGSADFPHFDGVIWWIPAHEGYGDGCVWIFQPVNIKHGPATTTDTYSNQQFEEILKGKKSPF